MAYLSLMRASNEHKCKFSQLLTFQMFLHERRAWERGCLPTGEVWISLIGINLDMTAEEIWDIINLHLKMSHLYCENRTFCATRMGWVIE